MILGSFWDPFGLFFSLLFHLKKLIDFLMHFGMCLGGFWGSRPSKIELSCKRDAHFDKITFFAPCTFSDAKWSPTGSENTAKRPFKTV